MSCTAALLAVTAALVGCSSDKKTAPPPAGPKVQTHLVFSGAVTATATGSVAVQPEFIATNLNTSNAPNWTTQCTFAGDSTADWAAVVTVDTPGNTWTFTIDNGNTFGNPNPGSHEGSFISHADNPQALNLHVSSKQPIADSLLSAGATEYEYYAPQDHGGAGTVTVDPGLRTGTLDVWLTPNVPNNREFRVVGPWSCA